jgi:periodic tryptophan protein 1
MISALGWIRRESAAVKPSKYRLSESDYSAFIAQANEQISKTHVEAREAGIDLESELLVKTKKKMGGESQDDFDMNGNEISVAGKELTEEEAKELSKYNLNEYDEDKKEEDSSDSDDLENDEDFLMLDEEENNGIFTPLSKLVKTNNGTNDLNADEFDEDELEDLTLQPHDLLFVAAKTEDEISQLEIYVYEEEVVGESGGLEDNLYVHHDLMLPSFPLCLEWIDFPCGGEGEDQRNFVAVGSFEKQIEIWNLNVLDLVYPTLSLHGHDDAVMSLSWNRQGRNFLASGSADNSVRLWDLNHPQQALRSFNHHTNKVQGIAWNPMEATQLLSAGYDGIVRLFDVRTPLEGINFAGKLGGDVEQIKWRSQGSSFVVSDESGRVSFFDPRNSAQPLAILDAHPKSATCIDFCPLNNTQNGNSIFLTASADKSLKVWSIDPSSTNFTCLLSREMGVGKIFGAGFLPDAPLVIAAAGNRGNVNMWNLKKEDVIKSYFTQPQ